MAALDTNILVRILVRDDELQLAATQQLFADTVRASDTLYVPITVTLELEWVLRTRFRFSKPDVMRALSELLGAVELSFQFDSALEIALALYRNGTADFSDALHLALSQSAGETPFYTFDQSAAKQIGAQLLR